MQTAFELIRRAAARRPKGTAIVDVASQREVTFEEFVASVEAAAAGLHARGLKKGDRVAVVLPNSIEAGILILALHRAGAIPALMNPRLKTAEIAILIRQGEIIGCVLEESGALSRDLRAQFGSQFFLVTLDRPQEGDVALRELMAELGSAPPLEPDPDEPAFIFYTSGTTGLPKAVVLPQRVAEPRVLFMATQCGHTFGDHNRIVGLMPFYHVIGFFAVFLMSLAFNGTLFLFRDFVPEDVLKSIKHFQLTGMFATPTHLNSLVNACTDAEDVRSVKILAFAGAMMPERVLQNVRKLFACRQVNIYGTTEAMNSLFMANPTSGSRLVPGFYSEIRVVSPGGSPNELVPIGQDGELIVSANNDAVFLEYLGRPDATRDKLIDGWYRTSDAAVAHDDGTIEIKGRIDDTIISGGENIHPQEVEEILLTHPVVREAAVIGVPDDKWGHIVVACVVCDGALTEAELEEHFRRSSLADFKRPRQYLFMSALPRNATNKILRAVLVDQARDEFQLMKLIPER